MLVALGHPQQVTASFLPPQQLVTADLFPLYKHSLHYGVILVFILGLIRFVISFLNSGYMDFIGLFQCLVMNWMPSGQVSRLAVVFADPVSERIPWFSGVLIVSLLFGLLNMVYRYWTTPKLVM